MADAQNIKGKSVLFLLVDGFQSEHFNYLRECFKSQGANILIASFNSNDVLTSRDGGIRVTSVVSFAEAARNYYDAVLVADNVTADAIRENVAAMKLIEETWARGGLVASADEGAIDLMGAGIVDNKIIAAPPNLYTNLENAGAQISYTPIAMSDNVFSARADADMSLFCQDMIGYLSRYGAAAA
ncbi:MAG: DJ-1/PfpI family protein [Candidatus Aquicultor sp.]